MFPSYLHLHQRQKKSYEKNLKKNGNHQILNHWRIVTLVDHAHLIHTRWMTHQWCYLCLLPLEHLFHCCSAYVSSELSQISCCCNTNVMHTNCHSDLSGWSTVVIFFCSGQQANCFCLIQTYFPIEKAQTILNFFRPIEFFTLLTLTSLGEDKKNI